MNVSFHNLPPEVKVVHIVPYRGTTAPFKFRFAFSICEEFAEKLRSFQEVWCYNEELESNRDFDGAVKDEFVELPFYYAFDGEILHLDHVHQCWPIYYKFGGRARIFKSEIKKEHDPDMFLYRVREILKGELANIQAIFNGEVCDIQVRNSEGLFESLGLHYTYLPNFDQAQEMVARLYKGVPHIVLNQG
jgi:hypothetical protein